MKVRAMKSFSGTISMHEGEVRELNETETVNELIRIGYLEEVTQSKKSLHQNAEPPKEVTTNEAKRGKSKRN